MRIRRGVMQNLGILQGTEYFLAYMHQNLHCTYMHHMDTGKVVETSKEISNLLLITMRPAAHPGWYTHTHTHTHTHIIYISINLRALLILIL